jgi:hypothetical protein
MINDLPPGASWFNIIRLPTAETFAAAFTPDVTLVASVTSRPIAGPLSLRQFFDATRAMYDHIAFVRETETATRTYLEWQGGFQGNVVEGATVLHRDAAGLIGRILLFHSPREQVIAFSIDLERRLKGLISPSPFATISAPDVSTRRPVAD